MELGEIYIFGIYRDDQVKEVNATLQHCKRLGTMLILNQPCAKPSMVSFLLQFGFLE